MHERRKDGGNYQIVGNDTMAGQIASFMESLNLTHKQVFEEIPYGILLLMQKDKLHESSGDIVKKTSSTELAGNKIK